MIPSATGIYSSSPLVGLELVEDTDDDPVPVVMLELISKSIRKSNMSVTPTASSESENESGTIGSFR